MHLQWNIWTIRKEGEIMGDAIISVEELSKSFGQHEVLRKIDFNVEPGEIICIVGSSGSGKSTLLRCINKLETQTSGKIRYHGKEIGAVQKEINDYRSKVGMVFQSFNLFNNMTVLQNCMLCTRKVLHLSKEEAFDRAITHLKQVGMAPFINANPTQLSGGQKQRVAIAGVVAMEPKCIVLDEPTAMLDPNGRKEVLHAAHELNPKKGVTILLITHYMEEVVDADYVYVMDKGHVVMQGTPREIFSQVGTLKEHRLDVPQITLLADLLRQSGLDIPLGVLTREELVDVIMKIAG